MNQKIRVALHSILGFTSFYQVTSGNEQPELAVFYKNAIVNLVSEHAKQPVLCSGALCYAAITSVSGVYFGLGGEFDGNGKGSSHKERRNIVLASLGMSVGFGILAKYSWSRWAEKNVYAFENKVAWVLDFLETANKDECTGVLAAELEFCRLSNYERSRKRALFELLFFALPNLKNIFGVGKGREKRIVDAVKKVRDAANKRILELQD